MILEKEFSRKALNPPKRKKVVSQHTTNENSNSENVTEVKVNLSKSLSSYPRACEFCGKICSYRQVFFAHRKKCNNNIYTKYSDLLNSGGFSRNKLKEYVCYYCCKNFNRKFNLRKHLESGVCVKRMVECCKNDDYQLPGAGAGAAVEKKEYGCSNCGKVFRKKCNLQRHVNRFVCSNKEESDDDDDVVSKRWRCKLKCWEKECSAFFYKQIDLVQHLREQHGKTLSVERLEFASYEDFETWKTQENSIKFMNARKLTGSKRSSKGLNYYFVCQFYRKNESSSTRRKTNRRKTVGVVPNTKCPSRILVKECGSKVHVTYISTHNHELYDPLEKKPLSASMEALVKKRHTSSVKFPDDCVTSKDTAGTVWQVMCGGDNDKRQRIYTVRRIMQVCEVNECVVKCYEEFCYNLCEHLYKCSCSKKNIFCKHTHKVHSWTNRRLMDVTDATTKLSTASASSSSFLCTNSPPSYTDTIGTTASDDEQVTLIQVARENLIRLNEYLNNETIRDTTFFKELVESLQILRTRCDSSFDRICGETRKVNEEALSVTAIAAAAAAETASASGPAQNYQHRNVCKITNTSFAAPITDAAINLRVPIFQPFNINMLCLKSLDPCITERELNVVKSADAEFVAGWLYDNVIDSFMSIGCSAPGTNVYVVDTRVGQIVCNQQRLPEMWNWVSWNTVDVIFVPYKAASPSNHWILFVITLKESKMYILDTLTCVDSARDLFEKYSTIIECWCSVLKNFFGIFQCDVASITHTKQDEAYNSGVYVCWYAFQFANKLNLTDTLDTYAFRKHIHDTIVNGSQPTYA